MLTICTPFTTPLLVRWKKNAESTKNDLLRYEQNIVSHTLAINENRSRPIVWKYYQWLSLLFWDKSIECLEHMHVHFMKDNQGTYISSIISDMDK